MGDIFIEEQCLRAQNDSGATLQTRCASTCNIHQVRAAQREQLAGAVSGNTGETGTPAATPLETTFNIKGTICFLHFETGQFHPVQCHCHPSLTVTQAALSSAAQKACLGRFTDLTGMTEQLFTYLPVDTKSPLLVSVSGHLLCILLSFLH